MRISDWSSDVCSSDLVALTLVTRAAADSVNSSKKGWLARTGMLISPKASLVKLLPAVIPEADEPQALPARVISPGTSLIRSSRPLMPSASETGPAGRSDNLRSEEHTSELQSPMRRSYAVFCWKKQNRIFQVREVVI